MRVIAGKYRGRQLVSFKASHLRPTSDRVKESLFNILQNRIEAARVLDLFGGTGNLAIEALSRGAQFIQTVEKHPTSLEIIKKNLDLLKIDQDIKVFRGDVFKFLKTYKGQPFDIVLADPPFVQEIAHDVMEAISQCAAIHEQTLIAIESASKERLEEEYKNLHRIDSRNYGDKILSFFETKGH